MIWAGGAAVASSPLPPHLVLSPSRRDRRRRRRPHLAARRPWCRERLWHRALCSMGCTASSPCLTVALGTMLDEIRAWYAVWCPHSRGLRPLLPLQTAPSSLYASSGVRITRSRAPPLADCRGRPRARATFARTSSQLAGRAMSRSDAATSTTSRVARSRAGRVVMAEGGTHLLHSAVNADGKGKRERCA
ncbi:hypothetical protein OH76DRAFT_1561750 [Lentinus brumalis]|uniref:Uncharacterized protein n=1 Tax=Lentinus brumalis TaxID=2498619 RepID=A0A371CLF5_9APHY|nr:hypothetical protein OH76DRAFT_1561750 [Polyporus brumalis]